MRDCLLLAVDDHLFLSASGGVFLAVLVVVAAMVVALVPKNACLNGSFCKDVFRFAFFIGFR